MRNRIAILLAILGLMFGAVSCGGEEQDEEQQDQPSGEQEGEEEGEEEDD
ncbi:MAG TPA: hypothetical protein VHF70_05250 [Rubrobacteraceae bacterium]|nr:hypothetical protein [Rubrobacteraceae bacterium]